MNEIIGNNIAIIGYELEGKSIHNYLKNHFPDVTITIRDKQQKVIDHNLNTETIFGDQYLENLSSHTTLIRTPGLPFDCPQLQNYRNNGGHVTTATNIFFSQCKGKTIATTGTKGKSTTTSLIYHILSNQLPNVYIAGNIGVPMIDLLQHDQEKNIYVLELSSYQLEDFRYHPNIAILLEIVPEHLDHHQTLEKYLAAKANIMAKQTPDDLFITNPQYPSSQQLQSVSKAQKIFFYHHPHPYAYSYVSQDRFYTQNGHGPKEVCLQSETQLLGNGNRENICAAITVASLHGIPTEKIALHLKSFKPLPHRLEVVAEKHGITFVNDSIATTPEAAVNAIEAFHNRVSTLICGGYDRGLDYTVLAKKIIMSGIATVITLPDTGSKIQQAINAQQSNERLPRLIAAENMEHAVQQAFLHTPANNVCLLSPASASYNTYQNFSERGNHFKICIAKYHP